MIMPREWLHWLSAPVSLTAFLFCLALAGPAVYGDPLWSHYPHRLSIGRNIRHLPCVSRKTGEAGVCMFAITCAKANGTHLGTCVDRFYFGSCCKVPEDELGLAGVGLLHSEDNHIEESHQRPSSVTVSSTRHPPVTRPFTTRPTPSPLPSTTRPLYKPTTEGLTSVHQRITTVPPTLVTWTTVEGTPPRPPSSSPRPLPTVGSTPPRRPTVRPPVVTTQGRPSTAALTGRPPTSTTSRPISTTKRISTTGRPDVTTETKPVKPIKTTAKPVAPAKPTSKPQVPVKTTPKPVTTSKPTRPVTSSTPLSSKPGPSRPVQTSQRPDVTKPPTRPSVASSAKPVSSTRPPPRPLSTLAPTTRPPTKPQSTKPSPSTKPVPTKPVTTPKPTTFAKPPPTKTTSPKPIPTKPSPTTQSWVQVSVTTHEPTTTQLPDETTPWPTTTSRRPPPSVTLGLGTTTTTVGGSSSSLQPISSTTPSQTSSTTGSSSSSPTPSPDINQVEPFNMTNYKEVCGRRIFPESRVVGGEKSTFGKWPWQISLRQWRTSTYLHKCGAALLNENWAITAAHCVENVPPSDLLLRLGEHDLSIEDEPYGYQERRVQIVASHPQFDPRTFEYDLALLRFYEPVSFQPNIVPICVPEDDTNFVGSTAYVTGWGRLYEDGPLPSVLQEVSVPVINNTVCETMYRAAGYIEHIPNIFICAGWRKGGFDSCEGDSGGPMVIQRPDKRWLLAGIISWGIGCAEPNQPGVYTRISQFRHWINQILQF